jgi:NAD(P)-dependent dehydrogenase (short-subunit alcohol dehydrogenase family)
LTSLSVGATEGVGYETAKNLVLSSEICHVLVCSPNFGNSEDAVASLNALPGAKGTASALELDITDDASIFMAAQVVEEQYGHVDCLVNNAGIPNGYSGPAIRIRENMATSVVGPVVVTTAFEPLLKKSSDPRVIFVTSPSASLISSTHPATNASYLYSYYHASKAALSMIMVEYGKRASRIGLWGRDPDWLGTNQENREQMQRFGVPDPSVGGIEIARVVKGERDGDGSRVVGKHGVQQW